MLILNNLDDDWSELINIINNNLDIAYCSNHKNTLCILFEVKYDYEIFSSRSGKTIKRRLFTFVGEYI